jgi:teichoic acid transport system ATP-binding protein
MEPVVQFQNVYKTYSFYKNQFEKLLDILAIKEKKKNFSALKGISFEVYKGESIGVIGINGSGKSTLSNLLAQIGSPTSGKIKLKGEPSLISIAAGLNNNLSGLENIRLKCLMLGLKNDEIEAITPDIIEFADIGDFITQPVKNYSSGMKSRLGFAISVHTNPDILIIDEALSVGDQTFYEKCLRKMEEFKSQGKTIFFISHSISQVRSFCDRALWLHFGEIRKFGEKTEVLKEYKEFINWFNSLTEKEKKEYRANKLKEQFTVNIKSTSRLGSRNKKKKNRFNGKKLMMFGQFLLILFLFLFSVFLMFNENVLKSATSIFSKAQAPMEKVNQKVKPETKKEVLVEPINKEGFIITESVDVFSDENLTNKLMVIPFAAPIKILEKVNEKYKIQLGDTIGFINSKSAMISENKLQTSNYKLEALLSALPSTFTTSYSYYMAHIGMEYDRVKKNIFGLSEETINPFGKKVQIYREGNVEYTFNSNNVAESITVLNINADDEVIQNIVENAAIKNDQEKLYFTRIKGYEAIINLQKKTLSLQKMYQQ